MKPMEHYTSLPHGLTWPAMLNPRVQIIGVIWTAGIIQGGHGYLLSIRCDVDVVGWFHDVCGSILLRVCFLISFHFFSNI